MSKSKIRFITDKEGNKKEAVVPIKLWYQLLDELDELEDIKLYDEAKKEGGKAIPFEEYLKEEYGHIPDHISGYAEVQSKSTG